MGENSFFVVVARKLNVDDSELLVLCISPLGGTETGDSQRRTIPVRYSLRISNCFASSLIL
jgi:hypothetical protein